MIFDDFSGRFAVDQIERIKIGEPFDGVVGLGRREIGIAIETLALHFEHVFVLGSPGAGCDESPDGVRPDREWRRAATVA